MTTERSYQHLDQLDEPPGWRPGNLVPSLGNSRCYRCHRPWWFVEKVDPKPVHHDIRYNVRESGFALCERCWQSCTIEQRLEAYEWLAWQWQKFRRDYDEVWPVMAARIRASR